MLSPPPTCDRSPDVDPFDRMLLSTDGTVTTLLAACAGEPIVTRARRRAGPATLERLLATTGCWWHPNAGLLELSPEERVVARRASLRGERSGVAYVLAESLVVPIVCPAPSPTASGTKEPPSVACSSTAPWRPVVRSCA